MKSQPLTKLYTGNKYQEPLSIKLKDILKNSNLLALYPLEYMKEHFPKVFFFATFCYQSGLLADFISLLILTAFSSCLPFYYLLAWKIYYESMYAGNMNFFIQCTNIVLCFGIIRSSIESIIDILRDNLSWYLSDHYSTKIHGAILEFYTPPEDIKDKDNDTSNNLTTDQENFFQYMNEMVNRYVSLTIKMGVYAAFFLKSCGARLYHRQLLFVPLSALTAFMLRSILQARLSEENDNEYNAQERHRKVFQKTTKAYLLKALNGLLHYKHTTIVMLNKLYTFKFTNAVNGRFYRHCLRLLNKIYQKTSDLITPLIMYRIYGLPCPKSNITSIGTVGQTIESIKKFVEILKELFDTHTKYDTKINNAYQSITNAELLKNKTNTISVSKHSNNKKISAIICILYGSLTHLLINFLLYATNLLTNINILNTLGIQASLASLAANILISTITASTSFITIQILNYFYTHKVHTDKLQWSINKSLYLSSSLITYLTTPTIVKFITLTLTHHLLPHSLTLLFLIKTPHIASAIKLATVCFIQYMIHNSMLHYLTKNTVQIHSPQTREKQYKLSQSITKQGTKSQPLPKEAKLIINADEDNTLKYYTTTTTIWQCKIPKNGIKLNLGVTKLIGENSVGKSVFLNMLIHSIIKPTCEHKSNMITRIDCNQEKHNHCIKEENVIGFTQGESNRSHFELPPNNNSFTIINYPGKKPLSEAALFFLRYVIKRSNTTKDSVDYLSLDDESKECVDNITRYVEQWVNNCEELGAKSEDIKKFGKLPSKHWNGGEFGKIFFALQITMLSIKHFKLHIIDEPGNEIDEGSRKIAHTLLREKAKVQNKFVICVDHEVKFDTLTVYDKATEETTEVKNQLTVNLIKTALNNPNEKKIIYNSKTEPETHNIIQSLLIDETQGYKMHRVNSNVSSNGSPRLSRKTPPTSTKTESFFSADYEQINTLDEEISEITLMPNQNNGEHDNNYLNTPTIIISRTDEDEGRMRQLVVDDRAPTNVVRTNKRGNETPIRQQLNTLNGDNERAF